MLNDRFFINISNKSRISKIFRMAILFNLGSNYFLGEISFVTKALSAVLQLGVTMDYSIFLWHSYKHGTDSGKDKLDAMADAVSETFSSVIGSSITTIAGFIALCFMSFTLGLDLGIVMAKGVVFGVIGCITVLPSLILIFDGAIRKTSHKPLIPNFSRMTKFITEHSWIFAVIFLAMLPPAIYGYTHTSVYYNLDASLPADLPSIVANKKLADDYEFNSTHMILADADLAPRDANAMMREIKNVDGITFAGGYDTLVGPAIPDEMIPEEVKEKLKSDKWQLMLAMSEYKVASDEVNAQVEEIKQIIKKYDTSAMLIGEAPCTKDLIEITDNDFKTVSTVSIAAIFAIILVVFGSVSLPVVLVSVIEFAIFINMGIPCYTNTVLPFIASIVIGTIQLGATVDYAILMTTRYKKERIGGAEKHAAVLTALDSSINSVIVSALGFFAATFGVGCYSNIDMISSLCTLMARGALISMTVVIFVLPSMLVLFDRVVCATTVGMRKARKSRKADNSGKNIPVHSSK